MHGWKPYQTQHIIDDNLGSDIPRDVTHLALDAVKLAPGVEEALGAVAGDGGADAGDLLVHPGVMLNTPGDVSPGPVLLKWIKEFFTAGVLVILSSDKWCLSNISGENSLDASFHKQ